MRVNAAGRSGHASGGRRRLHPHRRRRQLRRRYRRSAERAPRDHRRPRPSRFGEQDGDRDWGHAAGRPGQARPQFRRVALARLELAQSELPRPADHFIDAAVAHRIGARARRRLCDPARRLASGGHGRPKKLGRAARPRRRLLQLRQSQLPDRRLDHRKGHRRAVRYLDARACAGADEARRLLQLADLQRCRCGPCGRARQPGRQAAQGRSPWAAARMPGVRQGRPAMRLSRWRLGENGSLFAPQGGLRIPPAGSPGSAACC